MAMARVKAIASPSPGINKGSGIRIKPKQMGRPISRISPQ
jgi:hypothetical protein